MQTEAQKRANAKYKAAHYERIVLRVKKGEKDQLKELADAAGLSLNEYILRKAFNR